MVAIFWREMSNTHQIHKKTDATRTWGITIIHPNVSMDQGSFISVAPTSPRNLLLTKVAEWSGSFAVTTWGWQRPIGHGNILRFLIPVTSPLKLTGSIQWRQQIIIHNATGTTNLPNQLSSTYQIPTNWYKLTIWKISKSSQCLALLFQKSTGVF